MFLDKEKLKEFIVSKINNKNFNNLKYTEKYLKGLLNIELLESFILEYNRFEYPRLVRINKYSTSKKKYTYSFNSQSYLVLSYYYDLVINDYDDIFIDNLLSYRKNKDIKNFFIKLIDEVNYNNLGYSYKVDIHSYFNSIDTESIIDKLDKILNDKKYDSFKSILFNTLRDKKVYNESGELIVDNNAGIYPGNPFSVFLANLYLNDIDHYFDKIPNLKYYRYSDDIILFCKNRIDLDNYSKILEDKLKELKLELNPSKIKVTENFDKFEFLGLSIDARNDIIDVADAQFKKMKQRIRRKSRRLLRNIKDKDIRLSKYIEYINNKINGVSISESGPSWRSWYSNRVSTRETINKLNDYIFDTAKYVYAAKHNKSRFKLKNSMLLELGLERL